MHGLGMPGEGILDTLDVTNSHNHHDPSRSLLSHGGWQVTHRGCRQSGLQMG